MIFVFCGFEQTLNFCITSNNLIFDVKHSLSVKPQFKPLTINTELQGSNGSRGVSS